MANPPADIGDVVMVGSGGGAPDRPGLIVAKDWAGWCRVSWSDPEMDHLWFPAAKLRVISRGCENLEKK